jgi:hypothetical protein
VEVMCRNARLTPKARPALELLAVDQRGLTETLLRTYGFTLRMPASLVRTGTVKTGRKTIEVVRIRISDAGRDALGESGQSFPLSRGTD